MDSTADVRDVGLGLVATGARVGASAGRAMLLPVRMASRAPLTRRPVGAVSDGLASRGREVRERGRAETELLVERTVTRILEDPRTEQMLEAALSSPGLERLLLRVLDSRLLDQLTERLLASPEMDRIVEHIASSPAVLAAVTTHTESLAEGVIIDVRTRSERLDNVAERTARALIRRPRK